MEVLLYMLDICSWKNLRMSARLLFSVGVRRPLATLNVSGCKWRSFTWKKREVRCNQPSVLDGLKLVNVHQNQSQQRLLTCSKDFSPASFPTEVMSSNTALFTSCWKTKNSVTVSGMHAVMCSGSAEIGVYSTYRILAQLFVGSHKPSLFSPLNKHLRIRHNNAYEMRLATWNTREKSNIKLMPQQRFWL